MRRSDSVRENHSTKARLNQFQWAEGAFRWVHKGQYTAGQREGQACVGKVFKSGSVFASSYFEHDISVLEKVEIIVHRFNEERFINERILLNKATVWRMDNTQELLLIEPFIEDFRKFNSNTGWTNCRTPWDRVMQALSHYSYHCTGGAFVLCDLQGGIYEDGAIITDPVVLSRARQFGPTDLGPDGISSFFSTHVCNEYCRQGWSRPRLAVQVFAPEQGTTMTLTNTAGHPPLSNQYRYYN